MRDDTDITWTISIRKHFVYNVLEKDKTRQTELDTVVISFGSDFKEQGQFITLSPPAIP